MIPSPYRQLAGHPWRRAEPSEIYLSGIYRMRAGHPVEEQQPGAVIDLVLEGPRFERIRRDFDLFTGTGKSAGHDEPAGAFHVTREVGHRHAALTALLP